MRRTSRTTRTSPLSNSTGLWFKGLAVCSLALFGHLVVRSLIRVRDGGHPLFARLTPGLLTVSVQASPASTEQLLQNIYYLALIAGYYFTAGVLGLGLVVLVVGILIVPDGDDRWRHNSDTGGERLAKSFCSHSVESLSWLTGDPVG